MLFNNTIISGTGKALPPLIFSNEDLVQWHGKKSAQWIYDKIGVKKRHSLFNFFTDSLSDLDEDDLAVEACNEALHEAHLTISDIDMILMATSTPTHLVFPDSACTLHNRLGARLNTPAFTMTSGCGGFLNCLMFANSIIMTNQANHVLICGASSLSTHMRPHLKDRVWLHSSIFGDGVSSLIISKNPNDDKKRGFSSFILGADPAKDVAFKRWGGSKCPVVPESYDDYLNDILEISFREVPQNLKLKFSFIYNELIQRYSVPLDQIDWILFNMSNAVHQRLWIEEIGQEVEKVFFNMENLGNCAAASLGLSIYDFLRERSVKSGDLAMILSVGTGLQYGGVFYKF